MALETGTYISDLVVTNPTGSDPLAQADDHLRLLKSTLKNTFPNVNGAVSATDEQLSNSGTAFDYRVPAGGIIMWSGAVGAIPTGWLLCDGTSGTPNLRDKFVIGAGGAYAVGASGGSKDAIVVSHTHTFSATTGSGGDHSHGVNDPGHSHSGGETDLQNLVGGSSGAYVRLNTQAGRNTGSSTTGISIQSGGAHTHSVNGTTATTGASGTDANLPPYYALCFIMKS